MTIQIISASNILNYHKVKHILSTAISDIELNGISDLVIGDIKFSGNAQRRLKHAILFHGTILYDFDLSLVTQYLKEPPIQPDYRNNRPHHDFIQNLPIRYDQLIDLFTHSDHFKPLEIKDIAL